MFDGILTNLCNYNKAGLLLPDLDHQELLMMDADELFSNNKEYTMPG